MSKTSIRFTVRQRGGTLGSQTLTAEVPEFNWERFKSMANAEAFAKKAYIAATQRLIRELSSGRGPTGEHHLASMEALIARALKFTQQEILDWFDSRDWSCVKFKSEPDKSVAFLREHLPGLASSEYLFPEQLRLRAAEIVAEVADMKSDPVADYLFVKLSQEQKAMQVLFPL